MMAQDGIIAEATGGVFPDERAQFLSCEDQIGKGLRELLFSGGTRIVEINKSPG
jgi:hypothetical protein